jgi:hypothetical protein
MSDQDFNEIDKRVTKQVFDALPDTWTETCWSCRGVPQVEPCTNCDGKGEVTYSQEKDKSPAFEYWFPWGKIKLFQKPTITPINNMEETLNVNFGSALEALKKGARIARQGWNGKNMFLFLLPAGTVPTKAIHDPALRQVIESEVGGETFEALGSIRMFTADKKILTGWLASQTDMLAEDWVIL